MFALTMILFGIAFVSTISWIAMGTVVSPALTGLNASEYVELDRGKPYAVYRSTRREITVKQYQDWQHLHWGFFGISIIGSAAMLGGACLLTYGSVSTALLKEQRRARPKKGD
jgi:hypothetical protein